MNSIEALKILKDGANHDEYLFRKDTDTEKATKLLKNYDYCYNIIEKDLEVLQILKDSPFILERLFDNFEFTKELEDKYFFGTITDDKVAKVKEWLGI